MSECLGVLAFKLISAQEVSVVGDTAGVCDLYARSGEKMVLIPRYVPRNADEAATFLAMEKQVLQAFRQAVPGAKLIWVESDALANESGAVHCVTHMIPDN